MQEGKYQLDDLKVSNNPDIYRMILISKSDTHEVIGKLSFHRNGFLSFGILLNHSFTGERKRRIINEYLGLGGTPLIDTFLDTLTRMLKDLGEQYDQETALIKIRDMIDPDEEFVIDGKKNPYDLSQHFVRPQGLNVFGSLLSLKFTCSAMQVELTTPYDQDQFVTVLIVKSEAPFAKHLINHIASLIGWPQSTELQNNLNHTLG